MRNWISIGLIVLATLILNSNMNAQEVLKKGARIVFLGDSITQAGARPGGYVSILKKEIETSYPDQEIEVIGAGISGNKVPDLQKRLQKDVLDKKPTCVVIYIGINDVWHSQSGRGTPIEKFESGLIDIITKIKGAGSDVVLCTPSVIGEKVQTPNPLDKMLNEYSAISRKVAKAQQLKLIDLRRQFRGFLQQHNPLDRPSGILTSDTVHLNPAGNDFVAEQMLRGLGHDKYRASKAASVMQHIVLFQFKDSVSAEEIAKIESEFGRLKDKIKEIIGYEAGTNVSPENLDQGFTHAFVVTFKDAAARDRYLPHKAHKEFVALLDGKIEKVLVIDFVSER